MKNTFPQSHRPCILLNVHECRRHQHGLCINLHCQNVCLSMLRCINAAKQSLQCDRLPHRGASSRIVCPIIIVKALGVVGFAHRSNPLSYFGVPPLRAVDEHVSALTFIFVILITEQITVARNCEKCCCGIMDIALASFLRETK